MIEQTRPIEIVRTPTVADQVFETLHEQILTYALPPGTKMSEVEVARKMGISRQPVREAFFRLSQLGFLLIRPQRATIVRKISSREVLQAMYIRTALEIEVMREATSALSDQGLSRLSDLVGQQETAIKAGDKIQFHNMDDAFHKEICVSSGVGFVWTLIKEKKTHMDRVRYLTLSFGAEAALEEHRGILQALKSRDSDLAIARTRAHLTRIKSDLQRIRKEHDQYFVKEDI